MSQTSQDLVRGIDLTGVETVTASEMTQLVDAGRLAEDKGMRIITTDTALNTPDVPNPDIELEGVTPVWWYRYKWVRMPFDSSGVVKEYNWNPNRASDATLLKWELNFDLEDINDRLDEVEADVLAANTTANSANTAAVVAANNATQALINSEANATNLAALTGRVTTAEADIDALQASVDELGEGSSAVIPINRGGTNATTENGARVNLGLEYTPRGFCLLSDRKDAGTEGQALASAAWTQRDLSLRTAIGEGSRVTLSGSSIVFEPGTYLIEAEAPAYGAEMHQIRVHNGTVALGYGTSAYSSDTEVGTSLSRLMTTLVVGPEETATLQIQHRVNVNCTGGKANNFGGNEIYTQVKITVMK